MDLNSMLNKPGDKPPQRQTSNPYVRPPPLPALETSQRSTSEVEYLQQSAGGRGHYAVPLHPTQIPAARHQPGASIASEHSYYSSPQTAHPSAQPTWADHSNAQSPYMTPSGPGGQQYPFAQHPAARPSLSRTPSSAHSSAPPPYTGSPVSSRSYSQQVPYSQNPTQQSQPGTPYRPPINIPRTSSHGMQYEQTQRTPSGASMTPAMHGVMPSPSGMGHLLNSPGGVGHLLNSPQAVASQQSNSSNHYMRPAIPQQRRISSQMNRERSVSAEVSPKTVTSSLPRRDMGSYDVSSQIDRGSPAHYRSSSTSISGPSHALHVVTADERAALHQYQNGRSHPTQISQPPPPMSKSHFEDVSRSASNANAESHHLALRQELNSISSDQVDVDEVRGQPYTGNSSRPRAMRNEATKDAVQTKTITKTLKRPMERDPESDGGHRRPTKRTRFKEPPIWAQRAKNTTPLQKELVTIGGNVNRHPVARANLSNGHASAKPFQQPIASTTSAKDKLLPDWEPSFSNIIPHEDLTRQIANFFFSHVVNNETFGTSQADGFPSQDGLLEIEAKLGTLIDRRTNDRVSLPIRNEAVLEEQCDVAFESNMNDEHHKRFNEMLNKIGEQSLGPSRVKIKYEHTKLVDTFYDLPREELQGLPGPIQQFLRSQPGRKPKLRVTRDVTTKEVKAKIIKVRIADLHVYSPRTEFDWRVSVSVELDWEGDLKALLASDPGSSIRDRFKDRVSYQQGAYQIDLTKVIAHSEKGRSDPTTYELEIEVSSDTVRQQGKLTTSGGDNKYEDLVKGFVDNVRLLTRANGFRPGY